MTIYENLQKEQLAPTFGAPTLRSFLLDILPSESCLHFVEIVSEVQYAAIEATNEEILAELVALEREGDVTSSPAGAPLQGYGSSWRRHEHSAV